MDRDPTRYVTIDSAGLKAMVGRNFFANWEEFDLVDAATLSTARDRIRLTIYKLIEMGPSAPVETILAIFQWCVEEFNQHDLEAQWICTNEREDICEVIDEIAQLAGVVDEPEMDDGTIWREW